MHFLKQTLLIMAVCFILQMWMPWWTLVFPCLIVSLLTGKSGLASFLAGFLAVGLLWMVMTLYIDWTTSSMLSQKISMIFPGKSVTVLRLITVLVGGLTGGFASLSGYLVKSFR